MSINSLPRDRRSIVTIALIVLSLFLGIYMIVRRRRSV